MTTNNLRVIAAQIPLFERDVIVLEGDNPRPVEISVGAETGYAKSLGFPEQASVLICVYVDESCAMELSLPVSDATMLSQMLRDRVHSISEKSA